MDYALVVTGFAKLVFGLIVGVVGIHLSARFAARLCGVKHLDASLHEGNVAVGVLLGAALVSVALIAQHAVSATFSAVDLVAAQAAPDTSAWMRAGLYGVGHVVCALVAGVAVLALGIRTFVRLTPDVDEIDQLRKGNVAAAIVLGAVMLVLALFAQQGLATMLDGLLPLPELGRDMVRPVS